MDAPPRGRRALGRLGREYAAGVVAVAASYAAVGSTSGFVAVPVATAVFTLTPGPLVTVAILYLRDLAMPLGFAFALALTAALFAAGAAAARSIARSLSRRAWAPVFAFLFGAGIAKALAATVPSALGAGLAMGGAVAVERLFERRTGFLSTAIDTGRSDAAGGTDSGDGFPSVPRRAALRASAVALFSGAAYLLGRGRATNAGVDPFSPSMRAAVDRKLALAREASFDLSNAPGLISDDFYEVDINAVDPDPSVEDWSLSITGAVEETVTFEYDDLLAMPHEHRFTTLRCVSDDLNGHKMDTAVWTGVPVEALLDRAGVRPDATHVMLRAVDDYFQEFPVEAFRGGLLAYGMNGEPLPRNHGYPLRALVLGHWGEVNVKWLNGIELLTEPEPGYWHYRGWHGTGPVNTVAKIWSVEPLPGGRVRVGGHAYAGTRGIRRVEVSTDGGDTWAEATLSSPLPDADTWRQWRYEWQPRSGKHEVVVRAVDGEGSLQTGEENDPYPSGATGWVSKTIAVE